MFLIVYYEVIGVATSYPPLLYNVSWRKRTRKRIFVAQVDEPLRVISNKAGNQVMV